MKKETKFHVYVSDAYYIYDKERNALEWATDIDKDIPEFESKKVETHDTLQEAMNSINNWGSRWVMYPSVVIENDDGEEVFSDYPELYKCECCGHEEWNRTQGGLSVMKGKDGKPLFPEYAI